MKNFRELISHHVGERGLLQNFIAKKLNVSNTFISRWKTDRFPDFETLLEFCNLINLSKKDKNELIKQYIHARTHREAKKAKAYLEKRKFRKKKGIE